MASVALGATLGHEIESDKPGLTVADIEHDLSASSISSQDPSMIEVADEGEWVYPHPTDFKLTEKPIDEVRQLNVAVIGAGLSGITAGILLPVKVPSIKLTIFEKNTDVGGTWLQNIYPGVRCYIPAHVYQSTFSPNTQWSEEHATGSEILEYWRSVNRKYNLYSKIRFRTKIAGCHWQPETAKWRLDIEDPNGGPSASEHFDYVVTAIGHFDKWKLPDYPGRENFKGPLMHSSCWDSNFDPKGKRIATIGNGASGIQVTTELRKMAAQIDHYARSRTWIAGSFSPGSKERQDVPIPISEEEKQSFNNPKAYLKYRKEREASFWRAFEAQIADSDTTRKTRENFTELMRKRLADDPSLLEKLVPDFPPHCRRLTPGPGYLEALTKENLTFIQTPIKEFTEDDWKPEGKFGWPYTYIGIGTPGFPNLSFILGPNGAGPSGTVPYAVETAVTYLAQILRKMSRQHIRTMTPGREATDAFMAYSDAFFPRTNLAKKCSSWSNGGRPGARIHGHWPATAAHLAHVRREPRWEDFEYEYERPENRFAYLGNGWTKREVDESQDIVSYLRLPEDNDLRAIHERWWEF